MSSLAFLSMNFDRLFTRLYCNKKAFDILIFFNPSRYAKN